MEGSNNKLSDAETVKFIDLFESKDCVWRTTSRDSDRNERLKAATELGREMNITVTR
jgi:hypothetical protein